MPPYQVAAVARDVGSNSHATGVVLDRIRSQEASFMVNFFGRAPQHTLKTKAAASASNSKSIAGTGQQKKKASVVDGSSMPELASLERVRAPKMKYTGKKRMHSDGDAESDSSNEVEAGGVRASDPTSEKKARRERGPNKAGRTSKQTHVSLMKRLKDFPGQCLKVSAGVCAISSYTRRLSVPMPLLTRSFPDRRIRHALLQLLCAAAA